MGTRSAMFRNNSVTISPRQRSFSLDRGQNKWIHIGEKLIVRVFIFTYLALKRAVETAQYFETETHALFREVQPAHGAARVTAPTSEAYPCLLNGKYVAVVVVIVVIVLSIFLDAVFT